MFNEIPKLVSFKEETLKDHLSVIDGKTFLIKSSMVYIEETELFSFEHTNATHSEKWNAVSIIRDVHNTLNPHTKKTRPEIMALIKIVY